MRLSKLKGYSLAGANPDTKRVANDFYATNPKALEMLLDAFPFDGKCLEPCVGQGHLANVIKSRVDDEVVCLDLIDRGYPNTIVHDYLSWVTNDSFDCIISNPPYSLAEEFIRKSLSLLTSGGICAMFLKIQFLESAGRKVFFEEFPPKYIYVFRSRMDAWRNGFRLNPDTNKPWQTTFCHAWFIWEKGSKSEPIVRWL